MIPTQDNLDERPEPRVCKTLAAHKLLVFWLIILAAMAAYFSFLFFIAFREEPADMKLSEPLTWGIPFGIGVLSVTCLLTCLYIHWASRTHDVMVSELRRRWGR